MSENMDHPIGNDYVLYTGGCMGTERVAEDMALQLGFQTVVKLGPNHIRTKNVTTLTEEELMTAEPFLQQAAKNFNPLMHDITQSPPTYTRQLLQRNYHIIKEAQTVYAFGDLTDSKKQVKGEAGWSVQLALDAHKKVYVYDIPSKTWHEPFYYHWDREETHWIKEFGFRPIGSGHYFQPTGSCRRYPTLHNVSAVVGSRHISQETTDEIKDLFQRTFHLEKDIQALNDALQGMSLANHFGE